MSVPRPSGVTPDKRRASQIFGSFSLPTRMPRPQWPGSNSPAASFSKSRPRPRLEESDTMQNDLNFLLRHGERRGEVALALETRIKNFILAPSDITAVFDVSRQLQVSREARSVEIGSNLLRVLLVSQDVPQSLRVDYAKSIASQSDHLHGLLQPQCLSDATNGGRNIDGLEQSILVEAVNVAMNCLQRHLDAIREGSEVSDAERVKIDQSFEKSLELLRYIIQFGPSLSGDSHPYVIAETRRMIEQVGTTSVLTKLLEVLDAFITRGELPDDSLGPVIECLCTLYGKSSQLQQSRVLDKARQTLEWLFSTHVKDQLLETLVIILGNACRTNHDTALASGALQLLTVILSDDLLQGDVDFDLDSVLYLMKLNAHSARLELVHDAASLLVVITKNPALHRAVLATPDWDTFTGALLAVYERIKQEKDITDETLLSGLDDALARLNNLKSISISQKYQLDMLFLTLGQYLPEILSENLLQKYERSLHVEDAHHETNLIITKFLASGAVKPHLRSMAATLVQNSILDMHQSEPTVAKDCIGMLLEVLSQSSMDTALQVQIVAIIVDYLTITETTDDGLFDSCVDKLRQAAIEISTPHKKNGILERKTSKPIATGMVLLFMRNINHSARRVQLLMRTFLETLCNNDMDSSASVMLLRVLFRLRSDINRRIFLAVSPEGEGLAATLSKTSYQPVDTNKAPSISSSLSDVGPVWMYGRVRGLPEDPPTDVSRVLFSRTSDTADATLDIKAWLKYASGIIARKVVDWEVFSYTIVHLGAQLTNQLLFTDAIAELCNLRTELCSQLASFKLYRPDDSTGIKSGDVAACLYHILTTLIGYHRHFKRHEIEEMLTVFINGIGAWGNRTSVVCIHALTLYCYELPQSIERDLVRIMSAMSSSVTKQGVAMHVLEFLAGLSRLPHLARVFRGDEVKMVFGVCFSYIDDVRTERGEDQKAKIASLNRSTDRNRAMMDPVDELPEYVFALAYFVTTFWFLALKQTDRMEYFDWIKSRLLAEHNGTIEEQALVTLDFAWRVTKRITGNVSLTPPSASDPLVALASEYSLMTLHKNADCPDTVHIYDRRASGTDEWTIDATSQDLEALLRTQALDKSNNPFPDATNPIALECNERSSSSISLFDRVSPVDFFKAGILYVGEDQPGEAAILSNQRGSPDYILMLRTMGESLPLQGCRFNTCGLDTSEALMDGDRTIWSRDDVTALLFHVTTLMPNHAHDPLRTAKKRHIGNDYVNVIFNNSGQPWRFGTIPSAFDYVYIVVSPEARATFVETRTVQSRDGDDWYDKSWFKVQVLTKEGFPNVGSASETKVVSGKALGPYVKNLVLNACIFADVWAVKEGGGGGGSWKSRLGQLRTIRERFGKREMDEGVEGSGKGKGKEAKK